MVVSIDRVRSDAVVLTKVWRRGAGAAGKLALETGGLHGFVNTMACYNIR